MAHIHIVYTMLLFINEYTSASTLTLFIRILTFVFSQIRLDLTLFCKKNLNAILVLYSFHDALVYDIQILINIFMFNYSAILSIPSNDHTGNKYIIMCFLCYP